MVVLGGLFAVMEIRNGTKPGDVCGSQKKVSAEKRRLLPGDGGMPGRSAEDALVIRGISRTTGVAVCGKASSLARRSVFEER